MAEIFGTLGVLAILAGGLLAAFSTRQPTRLKSWASAYLVLVAGLIQVGLAIGWQHLVAQNNWVATLAFIIFNLGNVCVILGTTQKARSSRHFNLVNIGGGLLAVSMLLLAWTVRASGISWTLVWFLALVLVIFISIPIGLAISARKHSKKTVA